MAAGEPLVTILVPTSPMPVTGYTMSVPRREVMDLNITIDQAFQFCVSCGVLVPPHQQVTPELLQQELTRRLAGSETAAITAKGENDQPASALTAKQEETSTPAEADKHDESGR